MREGATPTIADAAVVRNLSRMPAVFYRVDASFNATFAGWAAETRASDRSDCRRLPELGHAIAPAPAAFGTLPRAACAEASARRGGIERATASVDRA
jgi:hypothetical protein